jgi:hypothetical protein
MKDFKDLIRCGCTRCKAEADRRLELAEEAVLEVWANADDRRKMITEVMQEGLEDQLQEMMKTEEPPPSAWFR